MQHIPLQDNWSDEKLWKVSQSKADNIITHMQHIPLQDNWSDEKLNIPLASKDEKLNIPKWQYYNSHAAYSLARQLIWWKVKYP